MAPAFAFYLKVRCYMHWQTTRFKLELTRPWVMGIVNLTPDSFSDGGQHAQCSQALKHAERLLQEGAGVLDVGAESTRPGAQAVPLEDELARLMPFLREAVRWQVPISVDTYKPEVMQVVLDLGVDIVNDIWALRQPGAERVVVAHPSCGVCLMHMHRDPQTMQLDTMSGDVVSDVKLFLQARMQSLLAQGVDAARLVLDPGIGFGKTVTQNFELLAHQAELMLVGRPVMSAWSRKSSLGAVLNQDGVIPKPADRLSASVAAALLAVERGARLIRVHDVKATVEALKVWQAVRTAAAEN
jgi:dihydropteroate synthase